MSSTKLNPYLAAALTPAETKVVNAVRRGLTNPAIAAELGWTVGAVAVCLCKIYRKLGFGGKKKRDKRVLLAMGEVDGK